MKKLQKIALSIALITLFVSCQTAPDTGQVLSNTETRKEIMDTIANNSGMMKEMMGAMMNGKNNKMMMESHEPMMKMMKDNPDMMQSMMTDMMEICKNDSTMMSGMCKTMIGNQQMMDMMQKMKGKNMDMGKMNAMDTTKGTDHKAHH